MIEPRPAFVAFVVGLALLVGSLGYVVGRGTARLPRPSPASPPLLPSPAATPTPPASPAGTPSPFAAVATALPRVLREATTRAHAAVIPAPPTPRPTPTPTKAPTATPVTSPTIRFVNLPSDVRSRQPFTAEWRVDGPAGASGEHTTLTTSYQVSSSSGSAQSSASSKGSQSFGSFTVPKNFSTQLTYGGAPGTIHLRATARVHGRDLSTEASVRLAN